MALPGEPQYLHTFEGSYPLHEYHLALAGREWTVLHTGVILTFEDEARFFKEMLGQLPYGVALWPSAIALAYEIASRGEEAFAGKRVLELGAGTGLPGIVAASLGADVVQTDRQELAMTVCARNGELNRISGIERRLVDWNEWTDETHYDWIIGSDILYADTMHEALRPIFQNNLAPGGRLLLADPFRGPSLRFLEALMAQGWDITITKWNLGDSDSPRTIGLFELERTSPV
jgi:predicted nicotinamide N-methyase